MSSKSSLVTVPSCDVPQTNDSATAQDNGSISRTCSPDRRRRTDPPLSSSQRQMLLGCLLGDAGISRSSPTSTYRLYFRHGPSQAAYCHAKAEQLEGYVTKPPGEVANRGWGEVSVCFATVSSPAFDELAQLTTVDGKKTVTTSWVAALDWESIAYWVMDDGTRQKNAIHLCTHGFSQGEVELLACRLRELGLTSAVAAPIKVRDAVKYHIRINSVDSRWLSRQIEAWVHPNLQYKLVPERPQVTCSVCGHSFLGRKDQVEARDPVCKARECALTRHRKLSQQSMTEERRQHKNQRAKLRYKPAGSPESSA